MMDAIIGNSTPIGAHVDSRSQAINMNSSNINVDVDATCFMMDLRNLPDLFGEIVRPAARRVPVKDLDYFDEWLYVISDPIAVKVNAGVTFMEKQVCKRFICQELRKNHQLTLTVNSDALVLSKSQVNVPLRAMVEALRAFGLKECRVSFFGMKWAFSKAQPKIDRCVQYHMALFGSATVVKRNQFDIGFRLPTTAVDIFRFGESQVFPHRVFRKGRVHQMFNIIGFGSLNFDLPMYRNIENIKIYQELTHAVISTIPKSNLDDMPKTIRTLRTRMEQLIKLLEAWEQYDENELNEHLLGTRIEITIVGVHTVAEAYNICLTLDLLRLRGIEKILGGPFQVQSIPVQEVLANVRIKVQDLQGLVQGANHRRPSIRMRTALTEARQTLGWSGKHMKDHLSEARKWRDAEQNRRQLPQFQYQYDGWEMDRESFRPVIQDFIDNAYWQNHSRVNNQDPNPIFLQKARGSGYFKQSDVYVDRVGAARHFVSKYGSNWRRYVKARPVEENEHSE